MVTRSHPGAVVAGDTNRPRGECEGGRNDPGQQEHPGQTGVGVAGWLFCDGGEEIRLLQGWSIDDKEFRSLKKEGSPCGEEGPQHDQKGRAFGEEAARGHQEGTSAATAKKAPAGRSRSCAGTGQEGHRRCAPAKKACRTGQEGTSGQGTAKKAPAEKAPAKKAPAEKAAAVGNGAAPVVAVAPQSTLTFTPKPKPPAPVRPKSGPYSKDLKFLDEVRELLNDERAIYQEQATSLRAEADSLALEREPGDVQFDEESGEGGTVTVDRERNLALSGQATIAVEEIDDALVRIIDKTYGYCERCYQPIPKPRLRALPYARLCVACKSGGLSRR